MNQINPLSYFPNQADGRPISGGKLYIGTPDTDPKVVGNQKQVYALQENGSTVPISQPVSLSPGGTPIYNGSYVTLSVDGDYSIRIDDAFDVQEYYIPSNVPNISGEAFYFDTIAAMTAEESVVGNVYKTKGYTVKGDGGGGEYLSKTAAAYGSVPDGYRDHYDSVGNVLVLQEGSYVDALQYGVIPEGDPTANTAALQAAIDSAGGKPVVNPDGATFDLSALTFADGYYIIDYRSNDDTSNPTHPTSNATNERVRFMMNNNASGYNNEQQVSSGYSTGLILDVRRDVDMPNIGAGQVAQYGRTSLLWRQDGLSRVQMKYTDAAGDTSAPGLDDGWTVQFIEPRMTLNNIKASSFVATLALNDMVKGTISGARGWVKVIGASSITVTLLSGKFVAGDRIILEPAVETTTDAVSSVTGPTNTSRSNRLGFSGKQIGNVFSNIQGDDAVYPFNIGGILGIQQSGTTTGSYTNAELFLVDKLSAITKSVRVQMETATGDAVILVNNVAVLRLKVGGETKVYGGIEATGGVTPKSVTTAQLEAIGNAVNTTNKLAGMMVYNTTTGKPVWSSGTTAGAVWKDATGATVHTPV